MSDPWRKLSAKEKREVRVMVRAYEDQQDLVKRFLDQIQSTIVEDKHLRPFIHSTKSRLKDPEHLRLKLARKIVEARSKKRAFRLTAKNLFARVTDLAGFRVLHLHTRQMERMHPLLLQAFDMANLPLNETPFARTWDDEHREFFRGIGIKTEKSDSMYTSVHYVLRSGSKVTVTCEVQVRTLAEELWGEVDHAINYPTSAKSKSCREQIRVLARITSACTRLVDSVFETHNSTSGASSPVRAGKR